MTKKFLKLLQFCPVIKTLLTTPPKSHTLPSLQDSAAACIVMVVMVRVVMVVVWVVHMWGRVTVVVVPMVMVLSSRRCRSSALGEFSGQLAPDRIDCVLDCFSKLGVIFEDVGHLPHHPVSTSKDQTAFVGGAVHSL